MKRLTSLALAALLAVLVAACQPGDDEPTPTLDTEGSGAPLNPGGVEPGESQEEIDDEDEGGGS